MLSAAEPAAVPTAEPVPGRGLNGLVSEIDLVSEARTIVASSCSLEQRAALRAQLARRARAIANSNNKPSRLDTRLVEEAFHTLNKLRFVQQRQCEAMADKFVSDRGDRPFSDFSRLCEAMTSDAADESNAALGGVVAGSKALRLMAAAASGVPSMEELSALAYECIKVERAAQVARAARDTHALASA